MTESDHQVPSALPAPKILIVERDPAVRASLVEGLKAEKTFRLYEASKPNAVVQQLRAQVMDILIIGEVTVESLERVGGGETWLQEVLHDVKRLIFLTEPHQASPSTHPKGERPEVHRIDLGPSMNAQETVVSWTEALVSQWTATSQAIKTPIHQADIPQDDPPYEPPERAHSAHVEDPPDHPESPEVNTATSEEQEDLDSPIAPPVKSIHGLGLNSSFNDSAHSVTDHVERAKERAVIEYLPRPQAPSATPQIIEIAFEVRSQYKPQTSKGSSPRIQEEPERALVLWVGPKERSIFEDLNRACRTLNYVLVGVESAQVALRETRARRFEIAFVCQELNDMPGLTLVRSLRREVGESLPIAFIDSSQQVHDRLEGIHAGVSLFLQLESSVDLLTQSLRQLQGLSTHGSPRVLVIDDDEARLGDHVTKTLANSTFQISCLTSPLRILELLVEVQTDLLIIHADMEGLMGFEVCRTLRATPEWQSLPIFLMGERSDDEIKIAAYRSGADDYLSSDADQILLKTSLESRLERSRLIQERADRDGLTGLLLRRAFNDALRSRMAAALRKGSSVAVCLIDLDHFKLINDTYGHIAGDRVLSALGRLLSSSFRVEDLRGRWGGEEFVVAFSNEEAETALAILERARREFVRFFFDGEKGERFQSTFSAGIACFPQNGDNIESVFKVADERLYMAKEHGRNRILAAESFDDPPHRLSAPSTERPESESRSLVEPSRE